MAASESADVQFLQAVLDSQGHALSQTVDQQAWPVLETTVLLPELRTHLQQPHVQESLWLEKTARAYLGQSGPLYIHLKAGGNHPEQGFYLKTSSGLLDHRDSHYMALNPSPRSLDLILPHENGHLIMNQLMHSALNSALKQWPQSLFPHTVTATSNFLTAFSEGFGIHFETRIGDLKAQTPSQMNYSEAGTAADYYHESADFLSYAQSQRRYEAVKANRFIFLPLTAAEPQSQRTLSQRLLAEWVNPELSLSQLRNAQQIMANEGLIATLFYRLSRDPVLASTPLPADVMTRFGLKDPTLSQSQRCYLKIFVALADLKAEQIASPEQGLQPLMVAFIQNWAKRFPADQARLFALFLETTKYLTVEPKAAQVFQELYEAAAVLDTEALPGLLKASEKMRQASLQSTMQDPTRLSAQVGPELWLRYPEVKLDLPAFGMQAAPLLINLNTASPVQLQAIPELSTEAQSRILSYRQQTCFIRQIADLPLDAKTKKALQRHWVLIP